MTANDILRAYMDRLSLVDAALHQPASQSALSIWSTPAGAGAAVSGEFPADFAFHTPLESDPWWQVDLGWEYTIAFIIVHNRRLSQLDRADGIEVSVSPDGHRWTLVHKGRVRFYAGPDGMPLIIPPAVPGRYVRISAAGAGYLHLSQVEVLVADRAMRLRDVARNIDACTPVDVTGEPVAIAVIGTSNSLMTTGYTAGLREHPGLSIQANLSLGSSHATLIAYRWNDAAVAPCRVLLIDVNVNQQLAVTRGVWPDRLARQVVLDTLARCARLDLTPVFVILPEGWSYRDIGATAFASRETYIRLCGEFGIPFFDGYCVLECLAAFTTIPVTDFLEDPAHVDHRLRRQFGVLLAAALLRALPRLRPTRRRVAVSALSYVAAVPGKGAAALPTEHRTNSLLTVDLIVLRPGFPLQVALPAGSSVVGLVFNMARTNAALRIAGQTVTVKNLNSPQAGDDERFWVVCWALQGAVLAGDRGVSLECMLTNDLAGVEPNDHGNTPHHVAEDDAMVEMAGLIIAQPEADTTIVSFSPAALDLWQDASDLVATGLPPWPARLPSRPAPPTVQCVASPKL